MEQAETISLVMIDEYYHVYIAQDMILQLRQHYPHLSDIDYALPDSRRAVSEIRAKLAPRYHDVFEILANCCFETTLVRELVEFFTPSRADGPAVPWTDPPRSGAQPRLARAISRPTPTPAQARGLAVAGRTAGAAAARRGCAGGSAGPARGDGVGGRDVQAVGELPARSGAGRAWGSGARAAAGR
ncbi:hypothetical protein GCM10010300_80410 [Streptomyces olivaceoviridis]|uniref:hypothetical protein n=1 Tax=Streptomyces olivaceoviridis TaxID=1921 RepID=UPI0016771E93|nr:hypothetical protein [Streptomyces olivaceoviridis]GGZ24838.1 hypothetical protein GCM10010300_80410 [Streptomyces olivaceoviridis]